MQRSGYLPCHHHGSPIPEFQLYSRIFRNRFSALSSAFLRHSFLHAFLHLKNILSVFLSFRDVEVIIFPFSEIVNRYFLIFSDFYSLHFLKIQEIKKRHPLMFSLYLIQSHIKRCLLYETTTFSVFYPCQYFQLSFHFFIRIPQPFPALRNLFMIIGKQYRLTRHPSLKRSMHTPPEFKFPITILCSKLKYCS